MGWRLGGDTPCPSPKRAGKQGHPPPGAMRYTHWAIRTGIHERRPREEEDETSESEPGDPRRPAERPARRGQGRIFPEAHYLLRDLGKLPAAALRRRHDLLTRDRLERNAR